MEEQYVPIPKKRRRRSRRAKVDPGLAPLPRQMVSDYTSQLVRDQKTRSVLQDVLEERRRQFTRYGDNEDLADGTGPETRWLAPYTGDSAADIERRLRNDYLDYEEENGKPTWVHLVREEISESFVETSPDRLYAELIQVAALCVSWGEKIRARVSSIAVVGATADDTDTVEISWDRTGTFEVIPRLKDDFMDPRDE